MPVSSKGPSRGYNDSVAVIVGCVVGEADVGASLGAFVDVTRVTVGLDVDNGIAKSSTLSSTVGEFVMISTEDIPAELYGSVTICCCDGARVFVVGITVGSLVGLFDGASVFFVVLRITTTSSRLVGLADGRSDVSNTDP